MNSKYNDLEAKCVFINSNGTSSHRAEQVKNTNFVNTINFLIYLKDPWKLCGENCALETLNGLDTLIDINLKHSITFDYLNFDKKKQITEILIDYLKFAYESVKDNMAKYGCIYKKDNRFHNNFYNVNRSETNYYRLEILSKFAKIMWNWADKSPQFCVRFHELNGVRVLFEYLNDNSLISHVTDKIKTNKTSNRFDVFCKLEPYINPCNKLKVSSRAC